MRIKSKHLKKIKENGKLRNRLAYELGVHHSSITRWIANNDRELTTALALKIIAEELKIEQSDLLETIPA